MKSLKIFYMGKQLRDMYPHATRFQVIKWKVKEFAKKCVRFTFKVSMIGALGSAVFFAGMLYASHSTVSYASQPDVITVGNLSEKIDSLKNGVVDSIAHLENSANIPIVFDDNSKGTLSKKDKASIGCMQFKVSTIQKYEKDLYNTSMSDLDAVLLGLDCTKAKALAKDIIFQVPGGLWNWSTATKEMGAKVEIIKELEK